MARRRVSKWGVARQSGRKHIRRALKYYLDVDGASMSGAFRDAFTDVFHLMYEFKLPLTNNSRPNALDIADDGFSMCEQEREEAENSKLNAIPRDELLLHIKDYLQYDSSRTLLETRLKYESDWEGQIDRP